MQILPREAHTILFGDKASPTYRERLNSDLNQIIWEMLKQDLMDTFINLAVSPTTVFNTFFFLNATIQRLENMRGFRAYRLILKVRGELAGIKYVM